MNPDPYREILEQLATGDLTTDEAERRLAALDAPEDGSEPGTQVDEDAHPVDPPARPSPPPHLPPPPPPRPNSPELPHALQPPTQEPPHPPHLPPSPHPPLSPHPPTQELPHPPQPPTRDLPHPPQPPTQELPLDVPTVRAKLSGRGLVEVVGESVQVARLEGPHSASLHQSGEVTEVVGDVGDDSLLVVPADVRLDLEVNSPRARIHGLHGQLRAQLNVGEARVEGRFDEGSSEIAANVGQLEIVLLPGSDVRVSLQCAAHVEAGDIPKVGRGEWLVGNGTAELAISGRPGTISLQGG